MITDEERRVVASSLRESANVGGARTLKRELAKALGIRLDDCTPEGSHTKILLGLSDLIDVPTTVLDLTETTRTVHGEEVRGWECRECGQSCEEMYGEYEYCPHCGRKVVAE